VAATVLRKVERLSGSGFSSPHYRNSCIYSLIEPAVKGETEWKNLYVGLTMEERQPI
jgi:hypothetical protein